MSKLVIFFVVVIVRRNFFHTIPQFRIGSRYLQVSGPDFTDTRYQRGKHRIEVNKVTR